MMKTSWGKPVQNVGSVRVLLVTLSVGVCIATLMGCGNKPEKGTSPVADPIETLRKAAEQGDADAQYDFGMLYANGKGGVPEDHAEAFKWFHKAASVENPGRRAIHRAPDAGCTGGRDLVPRSFI